MLITETNEYLGRLFDPLSKRERVDDINPDGSPDRSRGVNENNGSTRTRDKKGSIFNRFKDRSEEIRRTTDVVVQDGRGNSRNNDEPEQPVQAGIGATILSFYEEKPVLAYGLTALTTAGIVTSILITQKSS